MYDRSNDILLGSSWISLFSNKVFIILFILTLLVAYRPHRSISRVNFNAVSILFDIILHYDRYLELMNKLLSCVNWLIILTVISPSIINYNIYDKILLCFFFFLKNRLSENDLKRTNYHRYLYFSKIFIEAALLYCVIFNDGHSFFFLSNTYWHKVITWNDKLTLRKEELLISEDKIEL